MSAPSIATSGDELARRERLNQIVVGAELKTDNTVLDLALSRQHDDGDIRGIANGAANALAGDLGEHKVEHDQVELMLLELLDRGLTVADAHNPVAFALEIGGADDYLIKPFSPRELVARVRALFRRAHQADEPR